MVVRMCIKKDFDMLTPLCIYIYIIHDGCCSLQMVLSTAALLRWRW